MKYIIGKKVQMTQLFDEKGKVIPCTVIDATPAVVVGNRTIEKDGYNATIVGSGEQKEHKVAQAQKGAFGKGYVVVKELRLEGPATAEVGAELTVEQFVVGDEVRITGTSKGKGFQGVVKRHGFHGGPRSHGQKHSEREAGSIGGGLRTRVPKGMRMAGRMGGDTVTVTGISVVGVDPVKNLLFIKGAVPGRRGSVVTVTGVKS